MNTDNRFIKAPKSVEDELLKSAAEHESNQPRPEDLHRVYDSCAPLDLHAMHTLYSGCTPAEKNALIERIWAQDSEIERLKIHLKEFDAVIDSEHIANSCINPLEDLKIAIRALKAERDELRATNERLNSYNSNQKRDRERLDAENTELRATLQKRETLLDECDAKLTNLRLEIERLRNEREAGNAAMTSLVGSCDELAAERDELRSSLADPLKVHTNILRGTIALTKAQAIHIAGLPADIENQLQELRATVEQQQKTIAHLSGLWSSAEIELERLKAPVNDAVYAVMYAASSWLDRTSNDDHRWVSLEGRIKIWKAEMERTLSMGYVPGWGTDGFPWNRASRSVPQEGQPASNKEGTEK